MAKKIKPTFKAWTIISEAVEIGVAYGYRRAHKHTDQPTEDMVKREIESAVMNELSEVIDFGD